MKRTIPELSEDRNLVVYHAICQINSNLFVFHRTNRINLASRLVNSRLIISCAVINNVQLILSQLSLILEKNVVKVVEKFIWRSFSSSFFVFNQENKVDNEKLWGNSNKWQRPLKAFFLRPFGFGNGEKTLNRATVDDRPTTRKFQSYIIIDERVSRKNSVKNYSKSWSYLVICFIV